MNLQQAYNQDTDKLDLVAFRQGMEQSGMSIEKYAAQLKSLGPTGEQAFLKVAQAIGKAELPMQRSNRLMAELWTTMKNTVRWQLTSSALHGFIGAVQTAYGYTKDLNESLNNIRIVTGQSVEQMAQFAKQANDAAKTLSTTTTDYTNAALIYYQQGLSDEEVEGRTNVTIKLANAAGESAETASEQLTAIWNNFYDGSKSLEYYADVMTALGASTASSTEEISQGLQKFAAVADTVGLSYEYATSALATITATTRESADTVGTALRTLFARIQGLQQDGQADDGTTLNKYSKALAEVGIQIKDTEGNLKGMDQILNEMGATWGTLTKAQQMALAQTVAGVRQYSQLIALMDNWTFFQENLTTAMGSEGTLQKQADIYAESWEAARDRVRAASEDIYDSLINEDFFIGLDNAMTPVLSTIATIIDSLGGMQGVAVLAATAMTSLYGNKMADGLRNIATNIGVITGLEGERARNLQAQTVEAVEEMGITVTGNELYSKRLDILKNQISLQGLINQVSGTYDESQMAVVNAVQERINLMRQQALELLDIQSKLKASTESKEFDLQFGIDKSKALEARKILNGIIGDFQEQFRNLGKGNKNIFQQLMGQLKFDSKQLGDIQALESRLSNIRTSGEQAKAEIEELYKTFGQQIPEGGLNNVNEALDNLHGKNQGIIERITKLQSALSTLGADPGTLRAYTAELSQLAQRARDGKDVTKALDDLEQKFTNKLKDGAIPATKDWATAIVAVGQTLSAVAMIANSIKSLGRIFSDEDMTAGEKFITVVTSLSMLIPGVNNALNGFHTAAESIGTVLLKNAAAAATSTAAVEGEAVAEGAAAGATGAHTAAKWLNNAAFAAGLPIILGTVAALAILGVAIWAAVKAYNADADAAKEATEQAQELNDIYTKQKDLYDDLTAKIEAYEDAKNTFDELTEGAEGYSDALKDANEKATALIESNTELQARAFRNDKGLIDFRDLEGYAALQRERTGNAAMSSYVAQQRANEANLGLQTDRVRNRVGSYVQYTDDGGNSASTWQSITESQLSQLLDIIKKNDFTLTVDDLDQVIGATDELKQSIMNNSDELIQLAQSTDTLTEANRFLTSEIQRSYLEGHNADYGQLTEVQKGFVDTQLNSQANTDAYTQAYNDALAYWQGETDSHVQSEYSADQGWNSKVDNHNMPWAHWGTGTYYDNQGNVVADNVDDDIVREYLATRDANAAMAEQANDYIQAANEFTQAATTYDEKMGETLANSVFGAIINGDTSNIDFSSLLDSISLKDLDTLQGVDQQDWAKVLGLDSETITNLGYSSAADFNKAFYDGIQSLDRQSIVDRISESAGEISRSLDTLMSDIVSEDVDYTNIFDDENYQSLVSQLEDLANIYPELQNEVDILTSDWEVGTQTYLEALQRVQDKVNSIELERLVDEAEEAQEEFEELFEFDEDGVVVSITADTEEFEDALDKLLSANHTIDIEIHTQAEQEFNAISAAMNDIREKASYIGEDFVVAADKLRILNNTFPGIIQNMTDLGNGTIQLNQEVVNSAINGARAEVAADAESATQRLQNSATILRAKQQSYLAMAQAAEILAQSETGSDTESAEARRVISEELTNIKNLNSQISANSEMTNAMEIADNSADNAGVVASNWNQGFANAAKASAEFARTAIANMKSAAEGEGPISTGSFNFKVNYKGSNGVSGEASMLDATDQLLSSPDGGDADSWAALAQQFYAAARAAGAGANDIEGMIAQIGSSVGDLGNLFNNVSSGAGPSSKSGGGGKGSGSAKEPKEEDYLDKKTQDDLEDRYHEIERAIQDQEDALDDLSEAADRAYGTKRLDLFKKNLQALTKQADNYQAKMKLASHFIDIDKKALQDILPNISFGDNGEILRYQDLLDSILDEYNAFIDQYNAFIATYNAASAAQQEVMESELEAWKTAKEDQDELFDKKIEALKQYEESLDEWQQARDDWEDTQRQIEDQKLEEITYKMEVVLEIKNAEDVLTEFKKDFAESFGDALNNQYYGPEGPGRGTGAFGRELVEREMELLPHYEEEYAELLQRLSEANEFTDVDAIKDALLEVGENAIDSASKLLEWVNSIEEMVPDAIDAARERFDKFTSQLEHNSAMTDSIKELYELQGVTYKTQQGFDRLQKADQARLNTAVAQATLNRQWNQEAKEELDRARADFDGLMAKYNGDLTQAQQDVSFDTYKNNLDAALQEFNESEEAMYESAAEAMQAAQDMYLRGVEKTVYDFGQAVSGGIGLDFLQEKFDHYIDQEERYLDKVNEAYQVSSWYTKLQNDIDKTTNSAMAKRLKALQDEIDMRRENNTLSQYDLDILEAKYQVLQAQMALEDAQNAKNELRLVRDSQGNWNYQYTASQDEIANKQQELLEAENDWYNIAKQQVKDVTSEIVDTWKECQDAIQALYEDPSLLERPEELNAKKAEIEEYYSKKIQDLWAEHQIAVQDMTEAGNKDLFDMAVLMGDKVSDLTGLTSEEIKGIIDQYGGDIVGLLLSDYEDIQNILGDSRGEIDLFSNTFGADLTDMTTNAQNFEKDLQTALDNADKYFDTYNSTVHRVASETGTDLDTLDAKTDELATSTDTLREAAEELIPVWWDMIGHVHDLTDEYLDLADAVMEAIRRMQELAEQSTQTVRAASGIDDIGTVGTNTNNVDFSTLMAEYIAGGGSYNDDTYQALYAMREQKINSLEQQGVSSDYWKARGADTQGLIEGLIASGTDYMSDEELAEWLKRLGIIDSRIAGYATGGYTGDFEDGKLAFLHEKELVLNQQDTENILAAVQTIRALTPELLRTIEAIMDNNASLNMSLVGRRIIGNTPVDGGIVEQNVHIEASFPNVTNSREIEQAFTNLINDASQWARKRTE